ncbi:MAG TPA: hypothetical protein VK540_31685 [Polyangiaceae bacterium]|nr:hypothetical protein [Polyangiaceae bacterium]
MKSAPVSSSQVLSALRDGPFSGHAFAFLREVSNGTGWSGMKQYADALVVSCWPSRGIWIGGVEIKVSRSDWLRELKKPGKSAPIQAFCQHWWVAAPPGIVQLDELPKTWGLYEVTGKKAKVARPAPELKPVPLTLEFIASILRNVGVNQDATRLDGRAEAYEAARAAYDTAAVDKLREELTLAKLERARFEHQLESKTDAYEELVHNARAFELEVGLPEGLVTSRSREWQRPTAGAQFKAAMLLAERPPAVLAKHFRDVADALDGVANATKGAA